MRTTTALFSLLLLFLTPAQGGPSDSVVDPEELLQNLDSYLGDTIVVTAKTVLLGACIDPVNCLYPPCCRYCSSLYYLHRIQRYDSIVVLASVDSLGSLYYWSCDWLENCPEAVERICEPFIPDSTYTIRGYLTLTGQYYTFVV